MSAPKKKQSFIPDLETFWKRRTFHDMSVKSITAINRRVLVCLSEYTLVVAQVSKFTKEIDEFPTSWLYHKWTDRGGDFVLHVDLGQGWFEVVGGELRLIRNNDLAILIPPIDA